MLRHKDEEKVSSYVNMRLTCAFRAVSGRMAKAIDHPAAWGEAKIVSGFGLSQQAKAQFYTRGSRAEEMALKQASMAGPEKGDLR